MKVVDGKIIECTESELMDYWLSNGWDDIYPYPHFKALCELHGTTVTAEDINFRRTNMIINELQIDVHKNAIDHGWWDGEERSFGDLISLCHSELSEAIEEFRNGHDYTETYYRNDGKPEGIPSELADCVIRIMDMCGRYGIDLEAALLEKHEYNKSRPYRHGGKVM